MSASTGAASSTDAADAALAIVDLSIEAATAYERADLLPQLTSVATRLSDPELAVVVLGEFKQGKSTLVDALLNTDVCQVDDDLATQAPWVVRHGEALGSAVDGLEITVPRRLLADGLVLIDTPGTGGLRSQHGEATLAMLASASAALFVSDASQELTAAELDFLRRASEWCSALALVETKVDLHSQWRRIVELDRVHLAEAGLAIPIFPVASPLRTLAVARSDAAMNLESGYPALLAFLRAEVVERGRRRAAVDALRVTQHVVEDLVTSFEAERSVLVDPDHRSALLAELEVAEQRADRLASGHARWQVTLTDGITDLGTDVEHDLRTRLRDLNTTVAERIDSVDPAKQWHEIEPWLRQQVTEQVAANQVLLAQRADQLARRVAQLFVDEYESLGGEHDPHGVDRLLAQLTSDTDVDVSTPGVVTAGLSVLRGSYGGMAMFGMIGGLFGLTLLLPITLGLGLVMGSRHLGEERKRQLAQRRQQAKTVARAFVDEVNLKVAKDTRDATRAIHRRLRDSWAARAAELVRGAQASLSSAREAARLGTEQAEARLRDIEAELRRLHRLDDRVQRQLDRLNP